MNLALLKKSIYEARWLWLACAFVLFVFCWIHVLVTSQVDMSQFSSILENIPDKWEKLAPVPFKKMISYPARIAITYEEPLLFLLMTVWCVTRSSDVVSGELGRGTMEMLLSQPVSRLQVFLTPVCVTILGIAGLALLSYAGTCMGITTATVERPPEGSAFGIPFADLFLPGLRGEEVEMERIPMNHLVQYRTFIPAALNFFCLGFFLAGICTLISSFDRYRWRTVGVMMAFYVAQMLAEILGKAFPRFDWARQMSFFRAYEPVLFISESLDRPELGWSWMMTDSAGQFVDLGPLTCNALLFGIGAIAFIVAGFVFCRRDIPAPV